MINHLWESTIFVGVVWLLTYAFRNNRAPVRYGLWLSASLKFLIPFSLLVTAGSKVPVIPPTQVSLVMEEITQSLTPMASNPLLPRTNYLPEILCAMWLCGFLTIAFSWFRSWQKVQRAVQAATPLQLNLPIKAISCSGNIEPGIFGVINPTLLLPNGIVDHLNPVQLQAVIDHELCHVRRRDNLTAAMHMAVEAVFWFHPLVWWIGKNLIEERERACDEEVLRLSTQPQVYVDGILNVCKFYLESPVACMSGVTGADLKKRIEEIMTHRAKQNVNLTKKLLLATAGIAVIAAPVLIGIVNMPEVRAQTQPSGSKPLTYAVASIKPSDPNAKSSRIGPSPGGGITITNMELKVLISFAYDVRGFQISSGPAWIASEKYDIQAKSDPQEAKDPVQPNDQQRNQFMAQNRERLRNLLAERFQLAVHIEKKSSPVYAMVLAKSGSKLVESKESAPQRMWSGGGKMEATKTTMPDLAFYLASVLGRSVIDRTGLSGKYDVKIESADLSAQGNIKEQASDESGPSIFTALQEQLGLKLESAKAPVDMIVIDSVEKPSAN